MRRRPRYSREPHDPRAFTESFDRAYSRFARVYDIAVKLFPTWRRWLRQTLPHIEGPRVLEVSPGTGWLLTKYADRFDAHAIDINPDLIEIARRNLRRAGLTAELIVGDVHALPYPDDRFDTVLTTMAFSGYPDGHRALSELIRVLRPGGRLIILDVNYPADGNRAGTALVDLWKRSGDLIRDMRALFSEFSLAASDREIGGFGSVHLYLATRAAVGAPPSDGE